MESNQKELGSNKLELETLKLRLEVKKLELELKKLRRDEKNFEMGRVNKWLDNLRLRVQIPLTTFLLILAIIELIKLKN